MATHQSLADDRRASIEAVLLKTYFANTPRAVLESEQGRFIVNQHVWQRYEQARYSLAPWVDRAVGLTNRRVVELGCGTGSSTAGFAGLAAQVDGYEIDQCSVDAARGRLDVLGIRNASASQVDGSAILATVLERHAGRVDGFLLYAVLEHMTIAERIQALRSTWAALPSKGFLVVIETPNRLTYTDRHTSHLPFFHMLPLDLAEMYYSHSKRTDFVDAINRAPAGARQNALTRWGNGVSYHEFDVAIGAGVDACIAADGFEKEVVDIYPIRLDDELLLRYFEAQGVGRHRAFTRNHLNFVLLKP
jgi:S-adenosylmethionine-dependent methyltransferase